VNVGDMNLVALLPEGVVALGAMLAVAADLAGPKTRRASLPALVACVSCLAALLLLLRPPAGAAVAGHFVDDGFSRFVRLLAAGGGLLLSGLSAAYTRRMDRGHGEFYGMLLLALAGVMLVAGVADLMSLFVSLELVTVTSYVLAAFKRNEATSTEAGLKYLVVGAVSSAVLLFGIALAYGATGTVDFAALSRHVAGRGFSPLLSLGTVLVFGGLFFKCAAVPFQVWAPDVYQGSPTPVTAFLSSLSKSAGVVLLLRLVAVLVVPAMGAEGAGTWAAILAVAAGVTLLYGNLGAIPQRDVKRLLAYSSIGHAGYLLLGLAAVAASADRSVQEAAASAVLVYLLAYYLTTVTAFAVVACVSAEGRGHDVEASYEGLSRRSPFLAFAMLLALLSLAGVPPMAGLIGKLLVFYAVVRAAEAHPALYVAAFVGAAGVVVSLYYYLLLIRRMYVGTPPQGASRVPVPWPARAVIAVGIVSMLAIGVYWGPVQEAATKAARALFATVVP
jgi:NADH-quinone oxidoreductase subunit N